MSKSKKRKAAPKEKPYRVYHVLDKTGRLKRVTEKELHELIELEKSNVPPKS